MAAEGWGVFLSGANNNNYLMNVERIFNPKSRNNWREEMIFMDLVREGKGYKGRLGSSRMSGRYIPWMAGPFDNKKGQCGEIYPGWGNY